MEKLIKLLNDYKSLADMFSYNYYDGLFTIMNSKGHEVCSLIDDCELISKKFGFIKWLYDNEKMKLESIKNTDMYWDLCEWVEPVENVIMHLSISDTPIDDLIKLLK